MSFVEFDAKPLRTREQVAREVHAVALDKGLDELASAIALMTISTEVGANDENGERQWWCPANPSRDEETMNYPHDSTSDDSRSSGYLQQQPGPNGEPWWGTAYDRMTLARSVGMFFDRLPDDYRRAADNPALAGQMAQRVQRSSYPDRYAQKWDEAWEVLRRALSDDEPTPPGGNSMAWTGDPIWLEDVLRPALGDRLKTLPGWQNAGHGDFKDIRGLMWHHTGNSRESAQSIRNGRPDLPGPLSNIHIAPDGTVTIVAVGVCWHAGQGSYPWLPTNNANWHMIGIECAWPDIKPDGSYDPGQRWPDAQIIAMRDVAAALTTKLGVDVSHNIGHKEYAGAAQGKWDPGNIDMNWFRGEIAKDMRGEFDPATPPTPPVVVPPPVLSGPANPRTDRQLLEEIWDQLRGPGGNGWPQLGGKTLVDAIAEITNKKAA